MNTRRKRSGTARTTFRRVACKMCSEVRSEPRPTRERAMSANQGSMQRPYRRTFMFRFENRFQQGVLGLALLFVIGPALLTSGEVRAQESNMKNMPGMGKTKQAMTASGTGTVAAVNSARRKVTLDHGPIAEIKWPAMKMEFTTAPSVELSKVKVGDKVRFTIRGSGSSYTVQSISPEQ